MATIQQTQTTEIPMIVLRPARGWSLINLRDLWMYRELIFFMTWRDLKVRYKQTVLGVGWAVLKPFMTMVVFSVFFGNLAKMPSDGVPYPIFSFTGLLPWELFATALAIASRSLVANGHMITKIYFPRIILPLSSILAGVVDFLIAFVILIGMMVFYRIMPTPAVWTLPLFLLLALITALGVGLWLAALNVLYRDINYITPFLTQFWLFITPIVYPASMLPDRWQFIYALNPMTGVVEGFRWAMLGGDQAAPGMTLLISSVVAVILLISGLLFFRRTERLFADMV
jgi:lipopolysaccharide transport system permease protein